MNQIVSLSGGKDSTAMLLLMLERGEPIHSVVWFDTGWEFSAMHTHIKQVEEYTGIEVVRLKPEKSFDYWMFKREIVAKKGPLKGQVHRVGYGWPSAMLRWCTGEKVRTIQKYAANIEELVFCVGFAADEQHRTGTQNAKKRNFRYPLIEWGITEKQALQYCYSRGFTWNGLYNHFDRVSCFCCPLKGLKELRTLRREFPELWSRMLDMDSSIQNNRGFKDYDTVHDLERRFKAEDRQLALFECAEASK